MKRAVYIGNIAWLLYHTALIQDTDDPAQVKAQFDDIENLPFTWTHGWTVFNKDEFMEITE